MSTTETSVTFSLAELTRLEEERIAEENQRREAIRAEQARARQARRDAEAAQLREQEARARSEAEAAAAAERQRAEHADREKARQRTALDVARIEAEARARLEADNAARAHELALLHTRTTAGRRRTTRVLAAALALLVCATGAAAYETSRHVGGLHDEVTSLKATHQALARERDHARRAELDALDRRHAHLQARPLASEVNDETRGSVRQARLAIDSSQLEHGRLRSFAEALGGFEARIQARERLAALKQRHADLDAWSRMVRKTAHGADAAAAASYAEGADSASLEAYERALDALRGSLAQKEAVTSRPAPAEQVVADTRRCTAGDPGCGLDGRPLF